MISIFKLYYEYKLSKRNLNLVLILKYCLLFGFEKMSLIYLNFLEILKYTNSPIEF